jgi:uncharacterized repeat protein (TIGR03803 family)
VQGTDGNFYGTTSQGGVNVSNSSVGGTVFKITPTGTLTTLYSFCSLTNCADGEAPTAGLVQGTDGNFYGTTPRTVFKITPAGALKTLSADGGLPYAGLVQGPGGTFYGTTISGGTGTIRYGTVFQISSTGTLNTLYSFCSHTNCTDGAKPYAGVVQGTDGNLYGTTYLGGAYGDDANTGGTVFKITVPALASNTRITATPNPVTMGHSATLQATVTASIGAPTGTIAFSAYGNTFASCTLSAGTCSISASTSGLATGTYPIVATYAATRNYKASASSALNVVVSGLPTSTILTVGTNPLTPPASETLTATVTRSASAGTPTGTVTFSTEGVVLGTGALNGSGVASITASSNGVPAGSYPVTARYNGDEGDAASTSAPVTLTVE